MQQPSLRQDAPAFLPSGTSGRPALSFSRAAVLVCGLLLVPAVASAQSRPAERRQDRREKQQDRHELQKDHHELYGDALDLARLQALLKDFDRARATRSRVALSNVDTRLRAMVREESRESTREVGSDSREAQRSTHEVARSRNERNRDVRKGKAAADDTRDLRDDRRDARDDRRDVQKEKTAAVRLHEIRVALVPLYGVYDATRLAKKRALIQQLIALAKREIHGDQRELSEDRRELREDRRELREDRRR